jgi:hypothetical protein
MTHKNRVIAAAVAVSLFGAGSAQAASVVLSNIVSTWLNGNPAANVAYFNSAAPGGTSTANWGTGGTSGYDFNSVDNPGVTFVVNPPPTSPNQSLGTFTHRNQPINAGSSITDIQLRITTNIKIDGNDVNSGNPLNFLFDFDHNETPNGANPCADGGANGVGVNVNGCADNVRIFFNPQSDVFKIGDVEYTLELIGFFVGNTQVSSFWTKESANNSADVLARVIAREDVETEVPLPAAAWLLLSGLAGLGVVGRRRSRATV